MHSIFILILVLISSSPLAQVDSTSSVDPDLIDVEMTHVMYRIAPSDLKTTAYQDGSPSAFNLKLCKTCFIKSYSLIKDAEILLNEHPLALKDLTISLIKKKFDVIQLGIDRSNKTVTYLYLGGISELNTKKQAQEQSDEY